MLLLLSPFCIPAVLSSILDPGLATWFLADISHCSVCPLRPPPPSPGFLQISSSLSSSILWNFRVETGETPKIWRPKLKWQRFQWVVLTPVQVEKGKGGGTLAMHGCFVSVFIWYLAWTHSQDKRKRNESERLDGCVYVMFGWIYKKWKKGRKNARKGKREMKDRHAETPLRMSKQKCLNDFLGEREYRINPPHQSKHNDFIFLTRRASSETSRE